MKILINHNKKRIKQDEKRNRLSMWHKWFAWHPVSLWCDGIEKIVWLSFIERKIEFRSYYDYWCCTTLEYKKYYFRDIEG